MQENIRHDLELLAQNCTNLHNTVYYLKTQDCYKLNNSMLKSNITNLQFILDNKPQYSISFDKQQEKNRFGSVSRYFGSVWHRNRSRSRTPNFTELEIETKQKNRTTDYSVRFRFSSVFGFR